MLLSIMDPLQKLNGGRAGSQSGSRSGARQGNQRRRQDVKRSGRFGTQERGAGTDGVANMRRRGRRIHSVRPPQSGPDNGNFGRQEVTPQNTLRNQRLGFNVRNVDPATEGLRGLSQQFQDLANQGGPAASTDFLSGLKQNVQEDLAGGLNRENLIKRQFESQLPFLNEQFDKKANEIAERTSALGRTGSGMTDREFAELENQQQLKREGLLGQITADAAQQAIQDRLGLMQAGQGLAGQQLQREAQAGRANRAALQGAGRLSRAASRLGLRGQQANQQRDLARQRHLRQQQRREDQLARQAMQDRARQMQFMQQGGFTNPQGAIGQAAQTAMMGANEFGANAGAINQQLQGLASGGAQQPGGIGQLVSQIFGGGSPGQSAAEATVQNAGGTVFNPNAGGLPSPNQIPTENIPSPDLSFGGSE